MDAPRPETGRLSVLLTCPPMLGMVEEFRALFEERCVELHCPRVAQTLGEGELFDMVPRFNGWIIGDDPATRRVFEAGKRGLLRAAVKWGIGVDNVDLAAAQELGIAVVNTPGMFGREVADLAMSYVTALARQTFLIDRGVREGKWPKPAGISLQGRTLALVGFGDIGRNVAKRALAAEMRVVAYDPRFEPVSALSAVENAKWPARLDEADFLVFACALTSENRHMLNRDVLANIRPGLRVVNVARGPLIDESALIDALESGIVHSAALDVFELEPLPIDSPLRRFEYCIYGSHNASNTEDAVRRTSRRAVSLLFDLLGVTSS